MTTPYLVASSQISIVAQNAIVLKHAYQETESQPPLSIQALATTVNASALTDILNNNGFPASHLFSPVDDSSSIQVTNWNQFSLANRAVATNANIAQPATFAIETHFEGSFLFNSLKINYLNALMRRFVAYGILFTVYVGSNVWRNCGLTNFNIVNGNEHNTQTLRLEFSELIFDDSNQLNSIIPTRQAKALNSGAKQ